MRTIALAVLGLAAAILAPPMSCRPMVRLATFNIEDFPKDDRQVAGAFAEIRRLGVPIVAVQEITRPQTLAEAALRELGPSWRTVTSTGDHHRLGLVYDSDRVALRSVRVRDETRVIPGAKPTLEAQVRVGGRDVRLLVVHFKAGGAEQAPVRALQLAALGRLIAEGGDVVVLGDFNATTDADRTAIREIAAQTGLQWATEGLACTAYWLPDGSCTGAALDHVLTRRVSPVAVQGPCAETCTPVGRCPLWHREVSDHCPITVELR